ncbi:hypothetical protein B0I35DRAFT_270663 [Stachybotrys elegans]|uniref:2EXR domain-containing protein n=1 Tax=Stachybotrys elegans TaxID=80388 RepID=A0A8K0SN98_9HYPO|nr:hypothetical protein B0I35DRAFT_270663 [Stachybotrys elegans]
MYLLQHLFSKLPTELRLRIWSFNLPKTRLVPITCGASPSDCEPPSSRFLLSGCLSNAPIPANLHACAESRAEALKHFDLFFGFARGPGKVFFNPFADVPYFGPRDGFMAADSQFHTFMTMSDPDDLACVRSVAISDALFWIGPEYHSMTAGSMTAAVLRQMCLRLPNLEDIIFVPRDQDLELCKFETVERMAYQIQTSMATVCAQYPSWRPPAWRILPLSALSQEQP